MCQLESYLITFLIHHLFICVSLQRWPFKSVKRIRELLLGWRSLWRLERLMEELWMKMNNWSLSWNASPKQLLHWCSVTAHSLGGGGLCPPPTLRKYQFSWLAANHIASLSWGLCLSLDYFTKTLMILDGWYHDAGYHLSLWTRRFPATSGRGGLLTAKITRTMNEALRLANTFSFVIFVS